MSRKIIEICRRRTENSPDEVDGVDPLEFLVEALFHRTDYSWRDGSITRKLIAQEDRDPSAIVVSDGRCLVRCRDGQAKYPDDLFDLEDRQRLLNDLQAAAPGMIRKEAYAEGVLLMPASPIANVPATLPAADYAYYAVLLIFALQEVSAFVCKIPGTDGKSLDPMELVDALVTLSMLQVQSGTQDPDEIDEAFAAYGLA